MDGSVPSRPTSHIVCRTGGHETSQGEENADRASRGAEPVPPSLTHCARSMDANRSEHCHELGEFGAAAILTAPLLAHPSTGQPRLQSLGDENRQPVNEFNFARGTRDTKPVSLSSILSVSARTGGARRTCVLNGHNDDSILGFEKDVDDQHPPPGAEHETKA
ncbi:MAG: hypothetical protein PVS3B2_15440 [Candidatus Dormibacteraceae bacterium]